MEIKDAYIVHIDFDGEIASKYSGQWLIFTELGEVKEVIREALNDLMQHELSNGIVGKLYIGEVWYSLDRVLKDDTLLEEFIKSGGLTAGNWEISIVKSRGE